MNKYLKILFIITLLSVEYVSAQPSNKGDKAIYAIPRYNGFEGIIKFVQRTFSDTTYYTYYIKNHYVRLVINDRCDDTEIDDDAIIFDLDKKTIKALKPSLRIYKDIDVKPYIPEKSDNFKIIKNEKNSKLIHGYLCEQWRVRNRKENTEITYWVTKGNYTFFVDFLKLWNRKEKHSRYYLQLKDSKGYFPIKSVERSAFRDVRMELEVVKIEPKKLEDTLFIIPDDYKNYDN